MRAARFRGALAVLLLGLLVPVPATVHSQSQAGGKADSLIREAQQALQSEDYRAAERYYEAAVAADRSSPEASCGLGQVYMALREYEKAVEALRNCKTRLLTRLRRAQREQARSQGSIDDQIRELRDAVQAIESGNRSGGLDTQTELERRIRELEQSKSREGVQVEVPPQISFALGTALLQVGLLDEAEREFLDVIRSKPEGGEVHNNLATVYLAQSRWDEAAEQIRLAEEAGFVVNPQMKTDLEFRNAPSIATTSPAASPRKPSPDSEPVSIEHEGRTCALKGRFVRIAASVTPSWGIHDPIVHFRTEEDAGWYSMFMLPAGQDEFAGILPKPKSARSFSYFIDVTSHDETSTRTDEVRVVIAKESDDCAEAALDTEEAGSILIVDKPTDVADAPPVPPGFSIRGTTSDAGILEMGPNKALIWGGVGLGAAIAGGVAIANSGDGSYQGPQPFVEAPGIAFLASDPPQGSTLSLSGGEIAIQLRIFSPEAMPGANITAQLATGGYGAGCILMITTHDLAAGQEEHVVIRGPTTPFGGFCDTYQPLDELRVGVRNSGGLGGFSTGLPPLSHLRVMYHLVE